MFVSLVKQQPCDVGGERRGGPEPVGPPIITHSHAAGAEGQGESATTHQTSGAQQLSSQPETLNR